MTKKNLKIGFIGAGSIGSLFGGYIAGIESDKFSTEVIFFCREAHSEAINKIGLKIYKDRDFKEINSIKAFKNERSYEKYVKQNSSFKFDFLFLTCKAYDIKNTMEQYKRLIKRSKRLIILQNGIGNEESIINYCSKLKIIRALTANGALLNGPGKVIHTGEGITKVGYPFLKDLYMNKEESEKAEIELKILRDLLNSASLETLIAEDIMKECWEKAFINIGINAIGALTHLPNGKLLEFESLRQLMGEVINEAVRVALMKNIKLYEKDYVSLTFEVARKTKENKNSMLQDILNKKITEIDYLNGKICKFGQELGVEVPLNKILTVLIKVIEKSAS